MTTLRMTRGDDRTFTVTITDSAGAVVDISEATLVWTARRSFGGAAVIEKATDAGITAGETTGQATLAIDAADTIALPAAVTDLVWDLAVTDTADKVQTPLRGVLRVDPDVSYTEGS
jgi:hypothetical protein